MIVVADSSPLNYLIQIQCEYCLPELYSRVLVPTAVIEELRHTNSPPIVVNWLRALPTWLEVRSITSIAKDLEHLGPGEREAIQLAEQERANLLLIDDRRGRLEAERRGMTSTGTLGVLLAAGTYGLLDAGAAFRKLISETNFRTDAQVRRDFLTRLRRLREETT